MIPDCVVRGWACYVLGCRATTYLTTSHRRFGRVSTCAGHDPWRHGYGEPLVPSMAPGAPARGPMGAGGVREYARPKGGAPLAPVGVMNPF